VPGELIGVSVTDVQETAAAIIELLRSRGTEHCVGESGTLFALLLLMDYQVMESEARRHLLMEQASGMLIGLMDMVRAMSEEAVALELAGSSDGAVQ
jgi:hypothetical protein